jgi:hypothetical protein
MERTIVKRWILISSVMASAMLAAATALAAPSFGFQVLPPGGAVSGPPGATVGWGYELTNTSSNWLELTALDSDPFTNGTPSSLFDFPILAPGASVSVLYDGTSGLFQLTWDPGAPLGFVNSGLFVVSGAFWDGDPLAGGNFIEPAADQSGAYSATVAGVPEPATLLLLLGSGMVMLAQARGRSRRR